MKLNWISLSKIAFGTSLDGQLPNRSWFQYGFMLVTIIVVIILVFASHSNHDCFTQALNGPMKQDSFQLIQYIKQYILENPSTEPYNLLGIDNPALIIVEESERFYSKHLQKLFRNKKNGFFIEAGALDGESMSNTLELELKSNWTGLLIEADLLSFKLLKSKNRKSWSANVCLSPHEYPSKEMFSISIHYAGSKEGNYYVVPLGTKTRSMHSLETYTGQHELGQSWFNKVQCLPLTSLLLALQVTKVDLLVLDVEGAEEDILKHFDLAKFDVQVMFAECKNVNKMAAFIANIESRGYRKLANISSDIVFVQKNFLFEDSLS